MRFYSILLNLFFCKLGDEAKTRTLIVHASEAKNIASSLENAILLVYNILNSESFVAGGGAIEMELSKMLHEQTGEDKSIYQAIATALEIIPRQLCLNGRFNATEIMEKLREKHREGINIFRIY